MTDVGIIRKIIGRGLYEAKDTGLIKEWYYNGKYNVILKSGARYSVSPECIVAATTLPGFPHTCERCGQPLRTGKVCLVASKILCHDCAILTLRGLDRQISPDEARRQICSEADHED